MRWLAQRERTSLSTLERQYATRINELLTAARGSAAWSAIERLLPEADAESERDTGRRLLMPNHTARLDPKPFLSAFDKAYRKDCLQNQDWPDPPGGRDWLRPWNLHQEVHDLVRTAIYCRFLDGASQLAERISVAVRQAGGSCDPEYMANETGYYAVHLSLPVRTYVTTGDWNSEEITFNIEVQVATMTQWVLRTLSHELYAKQRVQPPSNEKWQWDPASESFKNNYLWHLLHFADGVMVEIRDQYGRAQ